MASRLVGARGADLEAHRPGRSRRRPARHASLRSAATIVRQRPRSVASARIDGLAHDSGAAVRNPRDFFKPLAIGAPEPLTEIPFKPSRMIHFFDASNEKMAAKVPDMAKQADILLGNLEDAVPVDNKVAAREGLVKVAKEIDFGETALWTRVNSLESPWVLDDLTTLVTEIGDKLDVIMVPKVEGAWDIHYVDRLLAQLEAKAGLDAPILVHAILETAQGVVNLEEIADRQPADAGDELRPGRPRRLAADEDDPRRRRSSRLPGHRGPRPRRPRGAARDRPAGPVALLDRPHGRRLHLGRDPAVLRPLRRHQGRRRAARRSSAPPSCSAASAPGRCTRSRSRSRRRSSARTPTRSSSPRR